MSDDANIFKHYFGFSSTPTTDINAPVKSIIITGTNTDVDTGAAEDIIKQGGTYTPYTAADQLSVVSSSANDTIAGTGARVLLIEGLDENYDQILETVNLNGTSAVTTTNSYLRVNYARVVLSGSGQTNAGNITITDATATTDVISYLAAGDSFSKQLFYTTPRNFELFLTNTSFSVTRNASNIIATISSRVFVPSTNTIVKGVEFDVSNVGRDRNAVDGSFARIPEKSDLWYRVDTVSASNAVVTGAVRGFLAHNSWVWKKTII
jgi:hypothetical protein